MYISVIKKMRRPVRRPTKRERRNDTISKLSIHYGNRTENGAIQRAFIAHIDQDWIDLRLPEYPGNGNARKLSVETILVIDSKNR